MFLLVSMMAFRSTFARNVSESWIDLTAEELEEFRRQASQACTEFGLRRRDLKRTKDTSSASGVSPDTARSRPPSMKLLRRQLNFDEEGMIITCMETKKKKQQFLKVLCP